MANGRLRGVATFAGGAVLALLAARAAPPLVAQAGGRMRAAAGGDPFEALAEDHKTILTLIGEMAESPNDAVIGRTQRLLRLKRKLAAHAMAEEDVLYPMLHDRAQESDDAKRLYAEHGEIKIHLHALMTMAKDDPAWAERARELRQLLEEHIRQEEEVDFPKLKERLDSQATATLFGHLQREKAMIL